MLDVFLQGPSASGQDLPPIQLAADAGQEPFEAPPMGSHYEQPHAVSIRIFTSWGQQFLF